MSKKQKKILQILKIMQENQITIKDIQNEALKPKSFDLLCEVDGLLKRMPFEKGKLLNPIGLFPFEKNNKYIVFDSLGYIANGNNKMCYAYEHKMFSAQIPTVDFFEKLFEIRKPLNEALETLNKPKFRDAYLAVSPDYIPEANWIVAFFDSCDYLGYDFYEMKEEAQVCYIAEFTPDKKC